MALQEYKLGDTRYGYDPLSGQGVAFADQNQRAQYFKNPMGNVADLGINPSLFNATPGQLVTGPKDYTSIAKQAGYAGVGLEDLRKLISEGVTADERSKINQGLGIPGLEESVFKPAPSTQDLYQNAYSAAGLADIKKQADELTKSLSDRKGIKNQILSKVNENPWLSEASRLGRTKTDTEAIDREIQNIVDQANNYLSLYDRGISEVNNVVSRSSTDFSNEQNTNQAKLNYLLGKAEQQVGAKQSEKDGMIARYLPDYLTAKTNSKAPDTIGTKETGFFQWDPASGSFKQITSPKITDPTTEWRNTPLTGADLERFGAPAGTTWGDVTDAGLAAKPSDAQLKASGFAARVKDSIGIFEDTFKLFEPGGVYSGLLGKVNWGIDNKAPNSMKPAALKQHDQAARNFINAVLRRESGAAIADSEFENAYAQYLPKSGDDAKTIANKKANMNRQLETLGREAGSAWGTGAGTADSLFQQFEKQSSFVGPTKTTSLKAPSSSRTDRHFNPTAFTTDVAKTAGLTLGVDYVAGDAFPGNSNLKTAKLLKDPVQTTIQVLDRIGFYTQSGKQRWTHTAIPQSQWQKMSVAQKTVVVEQMYKKENGGKSSLSNFYA